MKYLTVLEAAKFIEMSDKTIRKYIKSGKIDGVIWEPSPFGPRQMIPLESLVPLVKRNSTGGSPLEGLEPLEVESVPMEHPSSTALVPTYDAHNMLALFKEHTKGMESRLEARLEERLEERDRKLTEVMRKMMDERKKEKPWWAFWR